jgi:hypothetical protein
MGITRRRFVRDSALSAVGFRIIPFLGSSPLFAQSVEQVTRTLEELFESPADEAWPWVYWWGNDGNVTREAITADLEAMQRVGVKGVLFMEVDQQLPKGPVRFMSDEWRDLMRHAVQEATRLGITFNMNNDGGWAGTAGPWITPELSMQMLVWSETAVKGQTKFSGLLPQPKTVEDYYRDIAVLAFPTPEGESPSMAAGAPRLTLGLDRQEFDSANLTDGNFGTEVLLPSLTSDAPQYLNIDFPEPFSAQAFTIALNLRGGWSSLVSAVLQASDDGRQFRNIRNIDLEWPTSTINFPGLSARYYRIAFEMAQNWGGPRQLAGLPLGEVTLHARPRIEDLSGKAAYVRANPWSRRQDEFQGDPNPPEDAVVLHGQVIDISSKMRADGQLDWDAPEGTWTVLRIGHTSTGSRNAVTPAEGRGLECDKLSKKAIEAQFAGLIGKLLEEQGRIAGSALKMTHSDSWEGAGSQNWTEGFREEFQKRQGYDLLPYLPVLTGRMIESREVTTRFLWDLRRTIADMLLENHAGHFREISHQHGLTLSIEAYGSGPLDEVAYGGRADMPVGEFWAGTGRYDVFNKSCKPMASSAHVYGKTFVAAEAFTATPENGKWQNHPFSLKPYGDLALTRGINKFIINFCTMQSWPDRFPGMTTGSWGIHYDRTNTWWEQSRAWNEYLARCQSLLQSGQFFADLAYLVTENAPNTSADQDSMNPAVPAGYDYDLVPPEALLHATVRDGKLLLQSGMSYRVLVLPPGPTMRPALLEKIKELVAEGLTVYGQRPVSSPSLANYPQCDLRLQQLAGELWGASDGINVKENRYGQGKVVSGRPLRSVLHDMGAPPDFDCRGATVGKDIRYIHRTHAGDDLYFVASGVPDARKFLCTFRTHIKGRKAELWWPDTGRKESVATFLENQETGFFSATDTVRTPTVSISLNLDSYGSVFVVFRDAAGSEEDHVVSMRHNGTEISGLIPTVPETWHEFSLSTAGADTNGQLIVEAAEAGNYQVRTAEGHLFEANVPAIPEPMLIQGPWNLEFEKNRGAPEQATLDQLISWSAHQNEGIKYFSGTATYRCKFQVPQQILFPGSRLYLDLGKVCVIAEPMLNGNELGILWKPPFLVDITDSVKAGTNELAVSVVNLWPNRLIGDEHLPDDCEWVPNYRGRAGWGMALKEWPQWLLDNQPSPTGRVTFTTWKHWNKDDPLLESGLIGPVRIIARAMVRPDKVST